MFRRPRGLNDYATPALFGTALLVFSGCDRPPSPAVPSLPPVELSTARAAAGTLIETLKIVRAAAAARDAEAIRNAEDQLVAIAAVEQIIASLKSEPRLRIVLGDDLVRSYVRYWGPSLAYYLDAAVPARAAEVAARDVEGGIDVMIPANVEGSPTTIRVRCVPADSGGWRICRVDFAAASGAVRVAASTSAPASAPSSP